jgi:hypothetical protein
MTPISYKGFMIAKETEPWAIKCKRIFHFYPEGDQGPSDTWNNGFETIEQAKSAIDEYLLDEMDRNDTIRRYLRSLMEQTAIWSETTIEEWKMKLEQAEKEGIDLWKQYSKAA